MNKLVAALALVAFVSSATIAEARGGRTTAADCEAGSDDPDCPDTPPPSGKAASGNTGQPTTPPPPRR